MGIDTRWSSLLRKLITCFVVLIMKGGGRDGNVF